MSLARRPHLIKLSCYQINIRGVPHLSRPTLKFYTYVIFVTYNSECNKRAFSNFEGPYRVFYARSPA